MYPPIPTHDPVAVELEVRRLYLGMFPKAGLEFVRESFEWVGQCFTGRYGDYRAVDARYHDFEHTLQGTLCLSRLLLGRHRAGIEPVLTQEALNLVLLAILLHDTGYLKKKTDSEGTGAKYTVTHVARSADFAGLLLAGKGFSPGGILAVQNMIRCTGVNAKIAAIPFQNPVEKLCGLALATADLLGQMAAADYVEKLPILFDEFQEAALFTGDKTCFVAGFSSARDLVERTPAFWQSYVKPKLENEFQGAYRFLNDPFPSGPNEYLQKIESNIDRLRFASTTA